jgi:SAM-dependent methyltransferase
LSEEASVASQFYTGLVAELYEPLLSERSRAEDYLGFLDRAGTPALELACGSGLPLVELVQRGYEVEGLDSSRDMLDRCRARAAAAGLAVTLHQGDMQSFSLERRFRSIFVAGGSFTLLTSDEDARQTLRRIHEHLVPGGAALLTLEVPDLDVERAFIGRFRETRGEDGSRLRVGMVALETSGDGRTAHRRLRYERVQPDGRAEVLERDWVRRSWTQDEFRALAADAGFTGVRFRSPNGGEAAPEDRVFVALLRRDAG